MIKILLNRGKEKQGKEIIKMLINFKGQGDNIQNDQNDQDHGIRTCLTETETSSILIKILQNHGKEKKRKEMIKIGREDNDQNDQNDHENLSD